MGRGDDDELAAGGVEQRVDCLEEDERADGVDLDEDVSTVNEGYRI